jgi:hypothetical protein
VPVNTFQLQTRIVDTMGGAPAKAENPPKARAKPEFKVDRYGDPLR